MKPTLLNKSIFRIIAVFFAVIPFVGLGQLANGVLNTTPVTNASFTVPCGVTSITVQVWGPGGGGGGDGTNGAPFGAGGGGGGYSTTTLTVVPGSTITYTIGAGGAGGGGNTAGSPGTTASFFGSVSADPGLGGSAPGVGVGGAGGNGTTGNGNPGGDDNGTTSGSGGSSPSGGATINGITADGNGPAGNSPGGGGAGAFDNAGGSRTGGAGANGGIRISWVVGTLPTVNAGTPQTICAGTSATLAGSFGGSATGGTWSAPSGSFGSTTVMNTTYTPSIASGNVTLTLTNNTASGIGTCAVTSTVVITVNQAATANANVDQSVCAGNSITLAGAIGGSVATGTWTVGSGSLSGAPGGLSSTTLNATYTPSIGSGTVTLTLTSADPAGVCPAAVDQMVVTVNPAPSAAAAGPDQTLAACATSATLAATVPAVGTGTWTCTSGCTGVTFSPNANTANATVNGLTIGTNTTLTWTVANPGCTSNTDQVIINTVMGPGCMIYCTPAPVADCHGTYGVIENVTFNTINNTSTGQAAYQNFTAQNTTLSIGQVVPISVSAWAIVDGGGCGSIQASCLFVYIDWNADGDFNDASESTNLGPLAIATGAQVMTGNITVPAGAISGGIMRVVLLDGANCSNPCVPTGQGQVEDYSILILVCTTTPANAGPDQSLGSCVNSAALAATPVNAGAGETGYWTLISGNAQIADVNNPTSSISVLGPGAITLQWTVQTIQPGCPDLTDQVVLTTLNLPTAPNAGTDYQTCNAIVNLNGNAPGAGETGLWTVAPAGPIIAAAGNAVTTATGLVVGTPYTFTWTITNGFPCSTGDNVVITMIAGVTAANAGPDQTGLCTGSSINLAGNSPTNGTGTWTGASGIIADPSSPTTAINALNTAGSYTYTWTVSAPGCVSSVDQVVLTVAFCDPNITTVTCPGPIVFTDGGANYANNEHIVQKYCPSTPGQYITAVFSQMTMGTAADHMIVLNGANYSAPVIDDFYSLPTINGGANTITSSAADGCLTFIFLSNGTTNAAGWTANISCTATAGTGNVAQCDPTNCLGGCLRTICGVPATVPFTGDGVGAEELNAVDGGCLGAGETCSNWFLINPTNAGTLTLNMFVNSGQDQDFALWEAYDPLLECPAMTGDAPILCNFAGATAQGTGFNSVTEALPNPAYEPTLNISAAQITAGVYYIILVNTFNNGGACPQPNVSITFGGTAGLSCNPPIALGDEDILLAGSAEGNMNHLTWQVESETTISSYTIEKSKDGSEWTTVGVRSSNKSMDGSEYFMYDEQPYSPFTYYRVTGHTTDGQEKSSNIISVSKGDLGDYWVSELFPNPTSDEVSFQYQGKNFNEPVSVVIYNSIGQVVLTESIDVNQMTGITLKTDALANGTYQVKISQGEQKMMKKLSIIR